MGLCVVRHASRTSEPLLYTFKKAAYTWFTLLSIAAFSSLAHSAITTRTNYIPCVPASPALAVPPRPTDSFHKYFQRSRHSRCSSQPTFLLKLPAFSPRALCSHHHNLQFFLVFPAFSQVAPHAVQPSSEIIDSLNLFCVLASRRSRGPVVPQLLSMFPPSSQSALFGRQHSQTRNSLCIPRVLAIPTVQPSSQLINPANISCLPAVGAVHPHNPFLREVIHNHRMHQTSRPRHHIVCIPIITIVHK